MGWLQIAFEEHEVYAVDVIISSGDGKVNPQLVGLAKQNASAVSNS
jgi:hypothetical protein